MKAVVFKGVKDVAVEDRPKPTIRDPRDVIVKVRYTALCGSELHVYRGHQPSKTGFIMGHEFVGTIEQAGSAITTLKPGDAIVSPFTISCGSCFYCTSGFSSRCEECLLFGTALLDGAQAEYARVPLADSTLVKAPPGVKDPKLYLLMADVFPTGFFAAENAFNNTRPEGDMSKSKGAEGDVVVLLGCGPVGLCAVLAAMEYKPKVLLAVDSVQSRLDKAKELGAEPWNFMTDKSGLEQRVKELTDGRGADAVIEVVGHSDALDMAFNLLRPWGVISSVGVHNGEIPWTGNQAYGKNLTIKMGRCPVRTMFPRALQLLEKKQHLLDFLVDTVVPLSDAVGGYKMFDEMKASKVIFDTQEQSQ